MTLIKTALIVITGTILIAGCTPQAPSDTSTTQTLETTPAEPETDTQPATESAMSYTLEEVAAHATPEDCWLAIDGKVYDVTEFIAGGKHGGGDAIIEGCGKDATTLFDTRPMGSGTPHSEKARSFLPNFEIGALIE